MLILDEHEEGKFCEKLEVLLYSSKSDRAVDSSKFKQCNEEVRQRLFSADD